MTVTCLEFCFHSKCQDSEVKDNLFLESFFKLKYQRGFFSLNLNFQLQKVKP